METTHNQTVSFILSAIKLGWSVTQPGAIKASRGNFSIRLLTDGVVMVFVKDTLLMWLDIEDFVWSDFCYKRKDLLYYKDKLLK